MKEITKRSGMIFGIAKDYYDEKDGEYMISEVSRLESENSKLKQEIWHLTGMDRNDMHGEQ